MTMAGMAERGDNGQPGRPAKPEPEPHPLDELGDLEHDDVVDGEVVETPPDEEPADSPAPAEVTRRRDGLTKFSEYDWAVPKKMYVEGIKLPDRHDWPTLDEVAERCGIPANRVREKSAAKGWRAERTQYQHQLETTRRQARAAAMVQEATNLDNNALKTAKVGLTLVHAKLVEIAQAAQAARAGGAGSGTVIDALEQTRLAQAADLWHKIGLRAVGDPETHRLEVTGANGAPIEIAAELKRDDPERITSVLNILTIAGLGEFFGGRADAERTLAVGRGADGVPPAAGPRG